MSRSTLIKALYIAITSPLAVLALQAAPSLAAGTQDEVHYTRAAGPRVELRVTPPPRGTLLMAERNSHYVRG